jgi:hypothetical protein
MLVAHHSRFCSLFALDRKEVGDPFFKKINMRARALNPQLVPLRVESALSQKPLRLASMARMSSARLESCSKQSLYYDKDHGC